MPLSHCLLSYNSHLISQLMFLNRGTSNGHMKEDEHQENLLCRFVVDGTGKRIGESIGTDGDILIIKSGGRFLGVPLKHIEEQENMLLLAKGLIDFKKAYELGEQWRNNSLREISDGAENEETRDIS